MNGRSCVFAAALIVSSPVWGKDCGTHLKLGDTLPTQAARYFNHVASGGSWTSLLVSRDGRAVELEPLCRLHVMEFAGRTKRQSTSPRFATVLRGLDGFGSIQFGRLADMVVLDRNLLAQTHKICLVGKVLRFGHHDASPTPDELSPGAKAAPIPWFTREWDDRCWLLATGPCS